jgi:hypothetical protein
MGCLVLDVQYHWSLKKYKGAGRRREEGAGGEGEEMAQTMYVHMNKQGKKGLNENTHRELQKERQKERNTKPQLCIITHLRGQRDTRSLTRIGKSKWYIHSGSRFL